jgi:hypothetical protein
MGASCWPDSASTALTESCSAIKATFALRVTLPSHAALMLLSRSATRLHRVLATHQSLNSLSTTSNRRFNAPMPAAAASASGAAHVLCGTHDPACSGCHITCSDLADTTLNATGMLEAEEDRYDGVIIKPDSLPADPSTFTAALEESLQVSNQLCSSSSNDSCTRMWSSPAKGCPC